ncbi:MAG: type II secretion system F family protein [Chloroflexi bacterium]|nr:type II secretion system F family protein [Chloroflexota bacterium]
MTPPSWATRLLVPEVVLIPVLAGLMVYFLLQAHPRLRAYPRLADRLRALERARRSWAAAADPAPAPPSLLAAIGGPLLTEVGRAAQRILPMRGPGQGVPLATRLALVSPGATVEWFTGLRLLGLGVGLVLAGLLASLPGPWSGWAPTWPLPLFLGLGLLGLRLPRCWLDGRWAARQTQIRRALAPVLGSLAGVLESGQSVPTAIEELPRRRPGLLAREFTWALEEARSGRQPTLADALRAMARRNDVPELSKAVTVLRQSLTHNLAAAATLRHQVEAFHLRVRAERRRRASVMRQWQVAVTAPLVLVLIVFLLYPAWPRLAAALGLTGS